MAATTPRVITIFGGNGFIGRELLRRLSRSPSAAQIHVRVASRKPAPSTRFSEIAPGLGDLSTIHCDIKNSDQVSAAVRGATHVVNCVGILYETPSKGSTFHAVQEKGPAAIVDAVSTEAGKTVRRMVHVSAIGANEDSKSKYATTKAAGEREMLRLKQTRCHVTILRPSIVFGPEDSFFNRFNDMAKYLPFLPLVGGGVTKYQPVHVEDVARSITKCLGINGDETKDIPSGSTFELGGANVLTFKELMEMVLAASGRRRLLVSIPFPVANVQGSFFETIHRVVPAVPPLLTRDQVELIKWDNVVSPDAKTLVDLGIEPTPCSLHTISYLR